LKKEELADFPQNANPTYGQCHKKKEKKKRGLTECSMASKITPKRKKYWTLTLKQNIVKIHQKKKFYISYSLSARSKADLWCRKKKAWFASLAWKE
jgi:hypothetical protein